MDELRPFNGIVGRRVRGSWEEVISYRPTSRKESNETISVDMLLVHSRTCGRM